MNVKVNIETYSIGSFEKAIINSKVGPRSTQASRRLGYVVGKERGSLEGSLKTYSLDSVPHPNMRLS